MVRILLMTVALAVGGLAGPAAAQPDAVAMACFEKGDFVCAYREFTDLMTSESRAPLEGPEGDLSIAGARWEVLFRMAVPQLGNRAARTEAERLLEIVRSDHGDTRFMYATLHLVRAETCAALGDDACAAESRDALCANQEIWAAPFAMPAQGAEMTARVQALMSQCEE
ncbi:hypothetical protein NHN26_09520 [Rhodovulum tesquicola]|uniref:Uncharacterized protein n=1 Tax=Rhodovulum euryhalinum TaxID=35805 RepID=A0A4R2KH96_9RHOB|nr:MULTISPECIES: hypothetical protein [Rhodovulum]MCO8145463.1 hypothetical protein [Rhodovulum tesquicola]TCO72524.1 hypothetical protein EV655_104213 [Rhodovulum euryhalinum]